MKDKFIYISDNFYVSEEGGSSEGNLISQKGHVIGIYHNGEYIIVGDYGMFNVKKFLRRKAKSESDNPIDYSIQEEMFDEFYQDARLYEDDLDEEYSNVNPGFLEMAIEWAYRRNDKKVPKNFLDNLIIFNEKDGVISDTQLANFFLTGSI
jgi:hypothetical protein